MQEISISEILKNLSGFRVALEKGPVRITWKEPKPNGKVIFSAIAAKEDGVENVWHEIETPEDITLVGVEILVWDGCDHHIDHVDVCADTGVLFMSNNTKPTHWKPLVEPEIIGKSPVLGLTNG